jgi:hypothetical protein
MVQLDKNFTDNYLPLTKGNHWDNSYKFKEPSGQGRIIENSGKIKMEVQGIHRAKDYTVVGKRVSQIYSNSTYSTESYRSRFSDMDHKGILPNQMRLEK